MSVAQLTSETYFTHEAVDVWFAGGINTVEDAFCAVRGQFVRGTSSRCNKALLPRHFPLRKKVPFGGRRFRFSAGCVCQSAWVKVDLSFSLAGGQLYLLTYE